MKPNSLEQKHASVVLSGIPMPPQSNNCYTNVPGRGRVSTRELTDYRKRMEEWRLEHLALVNRTRDTFRAAIEAEQHPLRVDRYFVFPQERILTMKGLPKRMDASNRVKALDDELSKWLGLDDMWFWAGTAEKLLGPEQVVVVISAMQPRTLDQALQLDFEFGYPAVVRATIAVEDAFRDPSGSAG